ncbi:hypothetical protein MYE70_10485 [Marinobacter alexandrii]|uniref:hypothetical protein n=1 Tax=Marinobacter alexandrii TaxID=2570351 RepID=UPI0020004915|nr:hypothetical protein [Marinobacter alexandrii]MCK2149492.1 hypothetical protein [Marinobacter alexandrii]
MSGYIKIHRALRENPIWEKEPFSSGQAWIDLLLAANFKDTCTYIRKVKINLKRGQLAWSQVTMAKRWKWSRNRVARFLKDLENEGMIEQQTGQLTTVTTICNYSKYQTSDTAGEAANESPSEAADEAAGGAQYKKVKKDKKEKNNYTVEFGQFWEAYPRKEKKSEALKAFQKISPDQELLDRIISDVKARASSPDWAKENGKFVPHPTTYLNQRRWEDETPANNVTPLKRKDGAVRDEHGEVKGWWMFGGAEFVENPEYRRPA